MNTYKTIVNELDNEKICDTLYRFQGGKSFECFDIKTNKFVADRSGKYVYFSANSYHHLYFSIRRIRQLVNNIILSGTSYNLCTKQLYDLESFLKISRLIANSDKIDSIYSLKLICDQNFSKLMKDNSFRSDLKPNSNCIERVDRRVYNGGYGIKNEWLELLESMTFFTTYYKINTDKILEIISNMRISGKINSINNVSFLLNEDYNIKINEHIFNDFLKYEVMNLLETIVEKGMCHKTSDLYSHPTQTIKNILNEFETAREKTLKLVDKKFNDLII